MKRIPEPHELFAPKPKTTRAKTTLKVLLEMRRLLSEKGSWCQDYYYTGREDGSGKSAYCVVGAYNKASRNLDTKTLHPLRLIAEQLPPDYDTRQDISDWNDHPSRKHAHVLAVIDGAISRVEGCISPPNVEQAWTAHRREGGSREALPGSSGPS